MTERACPLTRAKDRLVIATRVYRTAVDGAGLASDLAATARSKLWSAMDALDAAGRAKVAELEALESGRIRPME